MTKRCPKCGVVKPLEEFYRNRNNPDGRSWQCGQCDRDYQASLRALEPERVRARQRVAQRRFRERHGVELDNRQKKAYRDAFAELRERHRAEFDDIYDEKLREVGVRSSTGVVEGER